MVCKPEKSASECIEKDYLQAAFVWKLESMIMKYSCTGFWTSIFQTTFQGSITLFSMFSLEGIEIPQFTQRMLFLEHSPHSYPEGLVSHLMPSALLLMSLLKGLGCVGCAVRLFSMLLFVLLQQWEDT